MKVNANKSKVMMLNGKEGLECDVFVDVSEFKYLCCVLDEYDTDESVS